MKCATPTAHPDTETIWFSCDADGRLSLIRPGDAAPAPAADGDCHLRRNVGHAMARNGCSNSPFQAGEMSLDGQHHPVPMRRPGQPRR